MSFLPLAFNPGVEKHPLYRLFVGASFTATSVGFTGLALTATRAVRGRFPIESSQRHIKVNGTVLVVNQVYAEGPATSSAVVLVHGLGGGCNIGNGYFRPSERAAERWPSTCLASAAAPCRPPARSTWMGWPMWWRRSYAISHSTE